MSANFIAHFRDCGTTGEASRENMARMLLPLQEFDLQKAVWQHAAIACTDRNSVMEFNRIRAQLFSVTHNEPIIRWRLPLPANQDPYYIWFTLKP